MGHLVHPVLLVRSEWRDFQVRKESQVHLVSEEVREVLDQADRLAREETRDVRELMEEEDQKDRRVSLVARVVLVHLPREGLPLCDTAR